MEHKKVKVNALLQFKELKNINAVEKPKSFDEFVIDFNETSSTFGTSLILCILLTIQLALAVGSYSGNGKPPMYGDFEAQRHWMEVTYNLPIESWYVNSSSNNLQYWGLDYPPITAYHHWVLGFISSRINPKWIELFQSRGHESDGHKLFMRLSAILPFFIFYIPPLLHFFNRCKITKPEKTSNLPRKSLLFAYAIIYPGLLAIDNAHFQYNSVSLGLFLSAFCCFYNSRLYSGSFFFVMALNYKQMELYHSLPIFVFILSRSISKPIFSGLLTTLFRLIIVGLIVSGTFFLLWFPFIATGTALDVLTRIFPFNRGIYEDKVASFWCGFSFVLKRLPLQNIQIYLSAAFVLIFALPSLYRLFQNSSERNFRITLFTTSLSFFLFSFHVHEKTILLVAVCAILLIPTYSSDAIWFLNITNISMFSLCVKDDNSIILSLFAAYFLSSFIFWKLFDLTSYETAGKSLSVFLGFLICGLELYGPIPPQLPHIYQLLNSFYCCIHFLYFLFLFTIRICKSQEGLTSKSKKE